MEKCKQKKETTRRSLNKRKLLSLTKRRKQLTFFLFHHLFFTISLSSPFEKVEKVLLFYSTHITCFVNQRKWVEGENLIKVDVVCHTNFFWICLRRRTCYGLNKMVIVTSHLVTHKTFNYLVDSVRESIKQITKMTTNKFNLVSLETS